MQDAHAHARICSIHTHGRQQQEWHRSRAYAYIGGVRCCQITRLTADCCTRNEEREGVSCIIIISCLRCHAFVSLHERFMGRTERVACHACLRFHALVSLHERFMGRDRANGESSFPRLPALSFSVMLLSSFMISVMLLSAFTNLESNLPALA